MDEKLKIVAAIFGETRIEDTPEDVPEGVPIRAVLAHGKYYGGVYNGRKYMYAESLVTSLSPERLEAFIKKQIGFPKED